MSEVAPALRERERELDSLHSALAQACAGSGRLLVIDGAAGIGKTSLLMAARSRAAELGMRTLSARGSDLERDFSFGIVRQLFEPVIYAGDQAARDRWFDGAAALARPLFESEPDAEARGSETESRFRRRHGLYWLVANIARDGPVLLAVDDAHWADEPSLGFLRHVSTRLDHLPLALVLGARPGAPDMHGFLVEPAAKVLRPEPLSPSAVASWVAVELAGSDEEGFAAACHRATRGNPFLLHELLREVKAEGLTPDATGAARLRSVSPRGIATSVLLRLAGLSPAATALARSLAILGEAELGVTAALAGLDTAEAVEAAAALTRAEVLEPADRLRFVHPIVRTVLYEDMPPAEREVAHARAARHLHSTGARRERVAAQLVLAQRVNEPWGLSVLQAAANDATLRGAPEVSARFLERALGEGPDDDERFELLLALGRAKTLSGDPDATGRMREAVALARTPEQFARAAVKLGRVLRYAGGGGEAVSLLEEAAGRLGDRSEPLVLLVEHELLAASTVSYEARRRLSSQTGRWWRQAAHPPRTSFDRLVHAARAVEAASRGNPVAEVVELAGAGLALRSAGDHLSRHVGLLAVYAFLLVDRFEAATTLLRRLAETAAERGGAEMLAAVVAQRALLESRRGAVPAAEADAVQALELAADAEAPPAYLLTAAATLVWVAVERGDAVHPAAAGVRSDGDSMFGRHLDHMHATLAIAHGRTHEGVAALLALGERECEIGWPGPAQFPWRSQAALALRGSGEDERTRDLVEHEVTRARALGAPRALGIALRARALLAEGDERIPALEEAVAVLAPSGAELEHARALVDLGATIRVGRQPAAAREALRRGYEIADRCGATRLKDRARDELLASGVRPRRSALQGRDALTPSEQRVAALAASDMTNRDIAQALFVTEKTVETHLSHAYAKLGVKSRRGLPAALAQAPAASGSPGRPD